MPSSFFKILLDATAPHLPIPPEFVTRHLQNKIPDDPSIRSVIGGHEWRVKIKKIGEDYCFADGWNNVVEDSHLGFGDFLVFRLTDQSTFRLLVYSPNGCVKDVPSVIQVDNGNGIGSTEVDDVIDEDDDDIEVEDEGEEVEVEDEGEEAEGEDEDDEVEVDDEEEEDEDDDDDEEEDEYYEEEKDDGDDEDDGEDDGGGDIDGHDGDPFFMLVISKTPKNILRLPSEFVALAGIHGEGTLILKNHDDQEWKVAVRVEKQAESQRYSLTAGWPDFQRSNGLNEGDECVFKFLRSEEKLLLAKVTHTKKGGKQSRPAEKSPVKTKVVRKSSRGSASKVEKRASDSGGRRGVQSEDVGKRTRARVKARGVESEDAGRRTRARVGSRVVGSEDAGRRTRASVGSRRR